MTEKNPTWIDGVQVSGQELRQALGGIFSPSSTGPNNARSAVLPAPNNPLRVTANGTPNMTVNVAAGQAIVAGTETANMGSALLTNDASVSLAIAASDATNPRIDLVVARWYSETVAVGLRKFALEVVTGSPAASPVAPANPANSIVLASISVPAAVSSIITGYITDTRAYTTALGGAIPCLSSQRPAGNFPGMSIFETDTLRTYRFDGSAFKLTEDLNPWQSYTPLLTATSVNPNLGSGAIQLGSWRQSGLVGETNGSVLDLEARIVFGTSGTAAGSGDYLISVPVTMTPLSASTPLGEAVIYDISSGGRVRAVAYYADATHVGLHITPAALAPVTVVGAAAPMAWDASDEINLRLRCRTS